MKKYLLLSIGLFSLPSFSEVSANVGFTTDYIWRGMTQSDGPAVSGGFDYASESGFYAGFGVPTLISTMVMVKNLITMLVMRLMSATQ